MEDVNDTNQRDDTISDGSSGEEDIQDTERRSLKELENDIRRERRALAREKPWHKQPSNIIAIIGIIITIFLTVITINSSIKRKVLTFSYSSPSSLLLFTPSVKSKASVIFDGETVTDLGRIIIRIGNTGTEAIESEDFKDGSLNISILSTEKTPDPNPSLPLLLDVIPSNIAGQRKSKLEILSRNSPAVFTYLPSLMNPNDSVEFEVYTSSVSSLRISLEGKIRGGKIDNIGQSINTSSDVVSEIYRGNVLHIVNRIFGGKIVALLILSIILTFFVFLYFVLKREIFYPIEFYEYSAFGVVILFICVSIVSIIFIAQA